MIRDQGVRSEIALKWDAIKQLCKQSHRQWMCAGAGVINETPPEQLYNLPFVLAYAALDEVLGELVKQGTVPRQKKARPLLGAKMEASRSVLPWRNYVLVESGKAARNDLAHNAKLLDKAACFKFIDAIEAELKYWGVLAT